MRFSFESFVSSGELRLLQSEILKNEPIGSEDSIGTRFKEHVLKGESQTLHGDLKEAESNFLEAIGIARETSTFGEYLDLALTGLGKLYLLNDHILDASRLLRDGYSVALTQSRHWNVVRALGNLAGIYERASDVIKAVEYYEHARVICVSHHLHTAHIHVLYQLAGLYFTRGQYNRALDLVNDAIMRSSFTSSSLALCRCHLRRASILIELHDIELANESLTKAKELLSELGPTNLQGTYHLCRAKLYRMREDEVFGEEEFDAAIAVFRNVGNRRLLANALTLKAEAKLDQRDIENALALLNEAEALASEAEDATAIIGCHEIFAKAYQKANDPTHALEHFQKYHELELVRRASDSEQRLELLRIEHEVERREKENELLRLKGEKLEQELSNQTLSLISQAELLSNFRDEIRGIVRKIPPTEPAVRELKEKLKALPCKSIDWEKFEIQFRIAHPDFGHRLAEKCPELTPTEMRVCSLLKMNMKSADIARLFCLSERAIEFHRLNIRKKLGLGKGQSLSTYFASI
jgi:tetratricopeptide (TPR) repeat protein